MLNSAAISKSSNRKVIAVVSYYSAWNYNVHVKYRCYYTFQILLYQWEGNVFGDNAWTFIFATIDPLRDADFSWTGPADDSE